MTLDIAIVQFRPVKANPTASIERISKILARVADLDPAPELLVFPESSLTGYFLEGGVGDHAWPAARVLDALQSAHADSGLGRPIDIAIGFYELHEHRVFNSSLYAELGGAPPRLRHIHRKVFLPTYGVFQEERFVDSGDSVHAFDTRWGRAAMIICEDAWHSVSGMLAALDGAQLIMIPSAAPARGAPPGAGIPSNVMRWHRVSQAIAEEHRVFTALAQLVGFEGGKGFAGGSTAYSPRGDEIARGPLWEEAIIPARLELDDLLRARVEQPLLADLERALPRLLQARRSPPAGGGQSATADGLQTESGTGDWISSEEAAALGAGESGGSKREGSEPILVTADAFPPGPPKPGDLTPLLIDTELVIEWLTRFIKDELVIQRGFERAVVAISGGVDSSVTAALAALALGPEAVTGLLLPYRTSSDESAEHARLLAGQIGIQTRTIDISTAVDGYLGEAEPDADPTRRGNVMARERMLILFDQAAKLRALPLGTGNKSERLLGYFTWHADDTPPINPIGDLFKTQVWQLARALGIPDAITDKPATADLIQGQTDEDDLGIAYPEADLILHHLLLGYSSERLERCGFDTSKVELVRDRLEGTHWKRNLPTVAMLSATTIGEWYLRPVDY